MEMYLSLFLFSSLFIIVSGHAGSGGPDLFDIGSPSVMKIEDMVPGGFPNTVAELIGESYEHKPYLISDNPVANQQESAKILEENGIPSAFPQLLHNNGYASANTAGSNYASNYYNYPSTNTYANSGYNNEYAAANTYSSNNGYNNGYAATNNYPSNYGYNGDQYAANTVSNYGYATGNNGLYYGSNGWQYGKK
jgi:hypothetical protein